MSTAFDPEVIKRWDEKSQQIAAEELRARLSKERQFWYCKTPGRTCDGKPHDGYPYKHARADQWPPQGTDWFVWMLLGGRGSGKTRSGSEYTRAQSNAVNSIAIVAPTGPDARITNIEGESGLIYVCERAGVGYEWMPSKHEFTFANGCVAYTYSAEEPDRLRGKQHGFAWLDEPAHYPLIQDVWDNLMFGLRSGTRNTHVLCTTTPLPIKWIKELIKEPDTVAVAAPTHLNLDNLAPNFRRKVVAKYEGTRQGRQELYGEILADIDGALWMEEFIRREQYVDLPFDRVVIGVDPAGTATKRSDETGIILAARMGNMYYVLDDRSGRMSPETWATKAVNLYMENMADAIVPEKNYGGDMVISTLRNMGRDAVHIKPVTARRGKLLRAEPIVALYEQGRVIHMAAPGRSLETLEQEMIEWVPGRGESPNRVDALVHALTDLANGAGGESSIAMPSGPMRGPQAPASLLNRGVWGGLPSQP